MLLHCIQRGSQRNMGYKMQPCFLNLMKCLKRRITVKLFSSSVVLIFALVFNGAEIHCAHQDIQLRRHFLAQFQCGSFWSIFGDFFFLLWMPISPSLTFGLWQQNRHHTPNFLMIDISIFKLVLTFPILAGIQPDQFRDWRDLGRNLVEERRPLPPQFCRGNHQLEGREW